MICFNNIPGIILIKINTDEMSQNSLCKKDINLLIVFKAQEFAIILLVQLKAFKWESFLQICVHQMSPFQKSKHLLILLTLCQKCMLLYLWWWLVCWKCYKNIWAIYEKNGKCFLWPTKDDPCWVPLFNCLVHVDSFLVQVSRAHT